MINSFKPKTGFGAGRVAQAGWEVLSSALGLASSLCLHSLQVRLPVGPPRIPEAGAETQSCLGIQLERREVEKEGGGSVL